MLGKLLVKLKKHKSLVNNLSYMSVLQVVNLVAPLATYPYLIRVLGENKYGLIVFSQSVVSYLVILVSFGFNISATKEVSIHREDKEKLSEIVSSTLTIKFLLFIASLLVLFVLLLTLPQMKEDKEIFLLSMWMCLYEAVFPMWYFQGIEKMKYITYISLVNRVIFIGLIFFFIHSQEDYLIVPVINGLGALIAGVYSLFIVFKLHGIKFKIKDSQTLVKHFKESYPIFISRVSTFKDASPAFLIGLLINNTAVAYYDLSTKIVAIISSVFDNATNVVFPLVAKERNSNLLRKIIRIEFFLLVLIYILMISFSRYIILFLGGETMLPAREVLFITGFLIFRPLSSIIGSSVLVLNGLTKKFVLNLLYSTVFYAIITGIILALGWVSIFSIALTIVLSLVFELAHRLYIIKKNNLIHWVL